MLWTWWPGASSGIPLTMSSQACVEKRATDLARQEKDLAFWEEMWERRNKLLVEFELEVEEKEKRLEGKEQALEEQAC